VLRKPAAAPVDRQMDAAMHTVVRFALLGRLGLAAVPLDQLDLQVVERIEIGEAAGSCVAPEGNFSHVD
jgi:hypothetical protein